jgi:hypothetical protein
MQEATPIGILQAAGAITTAIGFLSASVALWLVFIARQRQASLRQQIVGDTPVPPERVLEIVRTFTDDDKRLKALEAIIHGDAQTAKLMLDKAKRFDSDLVLAEQGAQRTSRVAVVGIFLLMFGVLALLAQKAVRSSAPQAASAGPPMTTSSGTGAPTGLAIPALSDAAAIPSHGATPPLGATSLPNTSVQVVMPRATVTADHGGSIQIGNVNPQPVPRKKGGH